MSDEESIFDEEHDEDWRDWVDDLPEDEDGTDEVGSKR